VRGTALRAAAKVSEIDGEKNLRLEMMIIFCLFTSRVFDADNIFFFRTVTFEN
jgi:hypothetical protein